MIKKKGMIQLVTGLIENTRLGYCQCHEHLFISSRESFKLIPSLRMENLSSTVKELERYAAAGGRSVVDAQPGGCGRMADKLLEASVKSGVQVVASTGFHKLCYYPANHFIHTADPSRLAEFFAGEISEGMDLEETGGPGNRQAVKAGVIKTALDKEGVSGRYEILFEAALEASAKTGTPIMCHVEKGIDFSSVPGYFARRTDPGKMIFCHLDKAVQDMKLHIKAAEMGFYIEYDTIARPRYHSDEREAEIISEMSEAGFADRILLGLDTNRERLKSYGGKTGLDYILKYFTGKMESAGITRGTIRKFTVDNPAKALSPG
jgi:phosphotriesterase-related protein